jgi:hypothetical protein
MPGHVDPTDLGVRKAFHPSKWGFFSKIEVGCQMGRSPRQIQRRTQLARASPDNLAMQTNGPNFKLRTREEFHLPQRTSGYLDACNAQRAELDKVAGTISAEMAQLFPGLVQRAALTMSAAGLTLCLQVPKETPEDVARRLGQAVVERLNTAQASRVEIWPGEMTLDRGFPSIEMQVTSAPPGSPQNSEFR